MKLPILGRWAGTVLCVLLASSAAGLRGQTAAVEPADADAASAAGQERTWEVAPRRLSLGFRLRTFPLRGLSVMSNERSMSTVSAGGTVYDLHSNIVSRSSRMSGGPVFEIRLGQKMKLRGEVLYTPMAFDNTTDLYSGTNDPATGADERTHSNAVENTEAQLWDVPLMLQYGQLAPEGILSRMYFAAGVAARHVSRVRGETSITDPGGNISGFEGATPASRNLLGGVVGFGFRFIDDFNINVTPEVRFTRWTRSGFPGAPKSQVEFGIGLSF